VPMHLRKPTAAQFLERLLKSIRPCRLLVVDLKPDTVVNRRHGTLLTCARVHFSRCSTSYQVTEKDRYVDYIPKIKQDHQHRKRGL
jgi:hypothetical protein